MKQLKKLTMEILEQLNDQWVNMIKDGAKLDDKGVMKGIDMGQMFSHYSQLITKLDFHFLEAEQRTIPKKRKSWMGG